MLTDAQLKARDAGRNLGAELLAAAQELAGGRWARKTTFEPLPDGSVRRTVTRADGTVEQQEVLAGPRWQLVPRALRQACRRRNLPGPRVCRCARCRSGSRAARCPAARRKVCSSW